jgi:hypothetical protein
MKGITQIQAGALRPSRIKRQPYGTTAFKSNATTRKRKAAMSAIVNEDWVRITYTKPENEMTTQEKAECELVRTAINKILERLHEKTSVGLIEIELYPCGNGCEECEAA